MPVPRYERAWLGADVVAGVTVAAMLVPQSMAYAQLGGLPPEAGLRAALPALVVYAVVGTSRHLGVGPEPGTAILAATAVGAIAAGDPGRYAALMAALALLVGAVGLLGAALRLGFLASALSRPVLVGYLTGVGLTLVTSQLARLTGVAIDADRPLGRLAELARHLGDVEPRPLVLGLACLALILAGRRWAPRLPGALLAVGLATAVVAVFDLDIDVVGEIATAFPEPRLPDVAVADLFDLVPAALGVTLVGYADNVLTARSIASRLGYRIDANRELAALGAMNVATGLTRGFPVSSSASRSAVPASLGSHTQLVGIVAAVTVTITLLTADGLLARFPEPAIAAVILAAAFAIIDVRGFVALGRLDQSELGLAVVATLGVVLFDVLVGVAVAVALSVIVTVWRAARPHDALLGAGTDLDGWVDVADGAETLPGLLVYRFDAPLFFANAARFHERVLQALERNPGTEEWVILDFEGVGSVDTTAVDELAAVLDDLAAAGVQVVGIARANHVALDLLRRAGLVEPGGAVRVFPTINLAVRAFRDR